MTQPANFADGINALFGILREGSTEDSLSPAEQAQRELATWWRDQTEAELAMLLPKVGSYGAVDLEIIGHAMAGMAGMDLPHSQTEQVGIAFYLLGKVARILSSLQAGQQPNPDSWLDAAVYSRMGLRANIEGKWL